MGLFDSKQAKASEPTQIPEVVECDRQLAALEQKRKDVICQIGQLYVDNNDSKTTAGTVFEEIMKEIEKMAEEVIVLEKRKLAAQGLRKCEKCGNILVLDSAFCNKCGDKLEPLFVASTENSNICSKCGTPHEEGAAFCTSCGNKLS